MQNIGFSEEVLARKPIAPGPSRRFQIADEQRLLWVRGPNCLAEGRSHAARPVRW
jgi:hypothetical protein